MRHKLLLLLLLSPLASQANVTLPALMTDNMVLQQKTEVALWGGPSRARR
ncbi:hypothetical protein [Hymenobacter volaticus]|uniref:Uncharacterized protein n=1 Tax=Hymenobacter volaticus TaxID=2932254 RepID=A0ABY4G1Q1_9BACT|nr:hypothetical protein [Hymenobacter volaticus]UOQ64793.1 hypothetical protein MUN86_14600 [Hymenobacter volaticus]